MKESLAPQLLKRPVQLSTLQIDTALYCNVM